MLNIFLFVTTNGSPRMNIDIFGALFTSRIQYYSYSMSIRKLNVKRSQIISIILRAVENDVF